jgi:integrase
VLDKKLPESPCQQIDLPDEPQGKLIPPRPEQVDAVIAAAPPRLRALVATAAETGLREGELLGLEPDAIDWLGRTITVRQQLIYVSGTDGALYIKELLKSKAGFRVVPVDEETLQVLAAHLREFPPEPVKLEVRQQATGGKRRGRKGGKTLIRPVHLIFQADKGGPIRRTTLHGRWERTLRRAGLPERAFTFHDLRHFYASTLIEGGASLNQVKHRLGHDSLASVQVYAHLLPDSDDQTRAIIRAARSRRAARPAAEHQPGPRSRAGTVIPLPGTLPDTETGSGS